MPIYHVMPDLIGHLAKLILSHFCRLLLLSGVYGSKIVKKRLKYQKFEPYFADYWPDLSRFS